MKKNALLSCLSFVFFFSGSNVFAQCSNGRYYDKIFSSQTTLNVVYGKNVKYNGDTQVLSMHIYEPKNDDYARRPLIILAFGGSFTSGVKESPDMLQLCDEFAKRGYVTATIDYRIGKENGDDSALYKAAIRGIQDMNAAVRFFNKDRCTVNKYRIDTSQIFVGGTSAGGFIGLNKAYFKYLTFSRTPPPYLATMIYRIGDYDGNSGNEGYSSHIKGVVNLCGAVMDTLWIQPTDPILVSVHGTNDNTVPFFYDSIQGSQDIKKYFYGSGDIERRCNSIGLNHYLKPFYGADHVPFVLPYPYIPPASYYMDTTIQVVRDFLFQNVVCDSARITAVKDIDADKMISIYPNPSDNQIEIKSIYEEAMVVSIYSIDGQLIKKQSLHTYEKITLQKSDFGAGMYLLQFSDKENRKLIKSSKITFY